MKRRFFIPEIVQSSQMDCGPAALCAVLQGFSIEAAFGRMREACQTSVDGTSIDTLEEVAVALGMPAEQMMLPDDHLLLPETGLLPAIAVTALPGGGTHFIVIWRRHGRWFQVMDPAHGRKWLSANQLHQQLYQHRHSLSQTDWFGWAAASKTFVFPLIQRLVSLGFSEDAAQIKVVETIQAGEWRPLATLDAATRCVRAMKRNRAVRGKKETRSLVDSLWHNDLAAAQAAKLIPSAYWSVERESDDNLTMRGSVFIAFDGSPDAVRVPPAEDLNRDLRGVLSEKNPKPFGRLAAAVLQDGRFPLAALVVLAGLRAAGTLFEALLWRGLMEIGNSLPLPEQRLGGGVLLLLFALTLLLLQVPISAGLLQVGRRLETRLRAAFLTKIPRLGDRYFRSRLTGDMAERNHVLHQIRNLPQVVGRLLSSLFALLFTTLGAIWLAPHSALWIVAAATTAVCLPLMIYPMLAERDMRVRAHEGGLSRFYLDALKGAVPIRAHAARGAVSHEHERQLTSWLQASLQLLNASTLTRVQGLVGALLTFWIVVRQPGLGSDGTLLLLIYWLLQIPTLGEQIAGGISALPAYRSTTLRLLEPLAAPDEHPQTTECENADTPKKTGGTAIRFEQVAVRLGQNTVLHPFSANLAPGEHIAVVGPSGAGKSSLLGLLLGRLTPSTGTIDIDGRTLDPSLLPKVRRETAWIEPGVAIWNDSLLNNLFYGNQTNAADSLEDVLAAASLLPVLEKRSHGLQSQLGDGGARLSGGEGQRVRLGRALLRREARLILLDEAFRGLDGETRLQKLAMVRAWWPRATLLFVSHDVSATLTFPRVWVIEDGQLVQDGDPQQLRNNAGRYRDLLESEAEISQTLWHAPQQRRYRLAEGRLEEQP